MITDSLVDRKTQGFRIGIKPLRFEDMSTAGRKLHVLLFSEWL